MTKLRWGLIGCGDISRKRVAPALRDSPSCELIGVSRARTDMAESFAREFGAKKWYGDWRELISDDEIDAVYVATPVHLHAEQTIAAANAGKHVLCEKPMALSVAECDDMIAACDANGVKLGVAYYRHFYPVVKRIKAILNSAEIGVPVVAQVNAFEWFDPPTSHPRAWLLKQEFSGGGPMFDFGCHRIEVLLDLLGEVLEVHSIRGNTVFTRDVEDVATALFKFKNGASATLTVAHSVQEPQDTLVLFCSRGSLHVQVLNDGTLRVVKGQDEQIESHPNATNIHQPLIEDFTESVIEKRTPIVDGAIGRNVSAILGRIYSSEII